MQAHATDRGAVESPHRRRSLWDRVLEAFSPTLVCDRCGAHTKLVRCERTGAVRTVPPDQPMTRWTPAEVEFVCPGCEGPIWVLDMPTYYPLF